MRPILIIARLTFREAIRRKIALAALLLGVAFLIIFDLGFYFIMRDFNSSPFAPPERVKQQAYNFMTLAAVYVVNFLCIAISALITADSLAGEIQSGTIQAIMTKPIRRSSVVLGKWLGHASLLFLYVVMLGGGIVLSIYLLSNYSPPNWPAGLALIFFNGMTIMTLSLTFSSSMSTLATGGAVFGLYGLAFIGGWVERIGTMLNNQTAIDLGILSSLVLPSEAIWNKAAALMSSPLLAISGSSPFNSASEPSPLMIAYAFLYVLAMLRTAVYRFGNRDI